jgi:oligoribonuclease NrnB/cAMP/cGMP phosphodiesterase (DHH superfamily)
LVDFSYKKDVMLAMGKIANSVLIIDHHKSAFEDLQHIYVESNLNVRTFFDMEHSGAMLAWQYFFEHDEPPQLLRHIEDRDLWKFELDNTKEIQVNLFSYPYDFEVWDSLMHESTSSLISDGVAIQRKHMKDIKELLALMQRRMIIAGHDVPVANLPYIYSSEAGHIMAQGEKFAACYYDTKTSRCFSLRSADDGLDVSLIAVQFGGGGHKHAAGFEVPLKPWVCNPTGQVVNQKVPVFTPVIKPVPGGLTFVDNAVKDSLELDEISDGK